MNLALGKTVLIGLPIMLTGTVILILGVVWQIYLIPCLLTGMTLICFGEGISFSVLYRFALMSSEVSKGTVAAAVSMLLMTSFFAMIELVRYLYTQFHLWAFVLSAFAFIALKDQLVSLTQYWRFALGVVLVLLVILLPSGIMGLISKKKTPNREVGQ